MTPLQVRTLWLTAPVVLGVVVYLLALDVWLVRAAPDDEATISATYGKLIRQWPIVNTVASMLFGIVIGHIAWGRDWSKSGHPLPRDDDPEGPPDAVA